jgi:hypothetical protein
MLPAAEEAGLFGTGQSQTGIQTRLAGRSAGGRLTEALVLLHVLLSSEQMADFGPGSVQRWKRTKIEAALEL